LHAEVFIVIEMHPHPGLPPDYREKEKEEEPPHSRAGLAVLQKAPSRPWGLYLIATAVFFTTLAYTLYSVRTMSGGMKMPGGWTMSMMWMPMAGQSTLAAAAMFIAMWTAMMVVMMLPSAMPMMLIFRRVICARGETQASLRSGVMIGGYFLVWSAFGAVTFAVGLLIARLEMSSDALSRAVPMIAGVCLIASGIYQWTRWKASCLKHCQDPISLVAGHLHRGWRGCFTLGLHHGMACAQCCWSLMLIQIVLGMMNLTVMAAITFVIAVEKLLPLGAIVPKIVGAIAILAGVGFCLRSFY
jgi:predicted metal-binding membrane protein